MMNQVNSRFMRIKMELLTFSRDADPMDGNMTHLARLTELPSTVPLAEIPLFEEYSSGLLKFASATCIVFILVGLPGNLITIIALARCKKQNLCIIIIMKKRINLLKYNNTSETVQ
ncbi:hypothetical protein Bhyg_15205 [Pseudolycoriella hygida]|uniref:Uncharacterized protein n=1 Tax=Pseudolycoriella hygida TaxID=35572 RepID=A0A9Q0MT15_9DIPT|nr:hypothetical protein Bhyg_15205 [Pseudolycoriella hygida]